MTQTTTQATDNSGNPVCDWCDEPVTDDAMEDARGWTVHEDCFDGAHDNDAYASFENIQCSCDDPDC